MRRQVEMMQQLMHLETAQHTVGMAFDNLVDHYSTDSYTATSWKHKMSLIHLVISDLVDSVAIQSGYC